MKKRIMILLIACLGISGLMANSVFAAEKLPAEIKIGIAGPMKFTIGPHFWNSSVLGAEVINAKGGVLIGKKRIPIKLVKIDTNEYLSVTDAVTAVERAITVDKVHFVTGNDRSEAILAMQDVCAKHKVIYLHGGSSPKLTEKVQQDYDKYKYCFRPLILRSDLLSKSMFYGLEMVRDAMKKELGIQKPKVAILGEKALWVDPIVKGSYTLFPNMGMEVVGDWRPSPQATDLSAELSAIKASGAQIIYPIFTGPTSIPYVKQWAGLEVPAASLGCDVESLNKEFWKATDGLAAYEATNTLIGPAAITSKTVPFWKAYVERFGSYPIYHSGCYDSVQIIAAAVERAGTLDTGAIISALEKIDFEGTIGRISFDKSHDLKYGPKDVLGICVQWQDGELKVVWPNGWEGIKYPGTADYKLPPWVVKYWKGK